ncbi:MAG: V-type ATPase 116kDa subunit family protein [Streptosporangiaceae bacterium]
MPWRDAVAPARMTRVALVAPARLLRSMLVVVATAAAVEIDPPAAGRDVPGETGAGVPSEQAGTVSAGGGVERALSATPPDIQALRRDGRFDVMAGEAELQAYANSAVAGEGAVALAGWIPAHRVADLAAQLGDVGCALVPMPLQARADVPTLLAGRATRAVTGLVTTYGTVPYADIDPTWPAWASYVLMFGIMFGDAGHGLVLIAAALCLRAGWPRWVRRFSAAWPYVGGAGVAATAFGVLYGEFFGPTGVLPVLWLAPLSRPIPLLMTAIAVGAGLLACAYALGTANRWREGGWRLAIYAPSGIAGSALFFGAAVAAGGWYVRAGALLVAGVVIAATGLILAMAGFAAEAGGGGAGVMQVAIESFDVVIRLGSNVVSFARLAAFGLTHAAIGLVVWEGTRALWHRGGALIGVAVVLFIVGNALAFALEALVVAIQALRLEYYELFSRVFVTQGRPFRPWVLRIVTQQDAATMHELPDSRERGAICLPG